MSDISNNSEESIERLGKYKEIMRLLRNTIITYAIKNRVILKIKQGKEGKWNSLLGTSILELYDKSHKSMKFFIHKIFDLLYEGYSNLQNQYYQKQLSSSFPL